MNIEVLKYKQKTKTIYVFTADPNYILKLVKLSDISISDENFQRPFDPKRIAEIKNYVQGKDKLYKKGKDIHAKGYIPNAIVLNLSDKYEILDQDGRSYIIFPNPDSIEQYRKSIEVIDGQHRLLAFDDECKKQLKDQNYEMCFVALIDLSDDEKKEIFMVLNERQKTVDKNILLRHKKLLNLLLDEEETRYEIISKLNSDEDSPFRNRIIMAGENIKYGLKSTQIDEVFRSSKALDKLIDSKNQINDRNYKILKNYFIAWQKHFKHVWFIKNNTLTKMAGFRFISYLFPYAYEVLKNKTKGKDFREIAFSSIVKEISDEHFNNDFDIAKAGKFQSFQERSGTVKLATTIGKELVEQYEDNDADILV